MDSPVIRSSSLDYARPGTGKQRKTPLPGVATAACVVPVFLTLVVLVVEAVWPARWEMAFVVAVVAAKACPVIAAIGFLSETIQFFDVPRYQRRVNWRRLWTCIGLYGLCLTNLIFLYAWALLIAMRVQHVGR